MFLKLPSFQHVRRLLAVGVSMLALVFSLLVVARASDKSDLSDADEKALAGYHLTAGKLYAFDTLNKKIAAVMQEDSVLKKEMGSGVLNVGSTLDDALAQFDRRAPHLAAVIKAGGMTVRDYVLSIFSIMFANSGQMMKQYAPDTPLPAYIPADNVALAEKDPARFKEVMKNLDRLTAKEKKDRETTTDD